MSKNDEKLDKIAEHISEINITLAAQKVTLDEHVRRSTALEAIVIPLQGEANMIKGALALIGILATIAGIAVALVSIKGAL